MGELQGDVMKLSILVLATLLACGNATSNEPTATPNANTNSQTQTTGATVQQRTYKTGDYNQTIDGNGMPGAGSDRAVGLPPGTVGGPGSKLTPRAPAPPNTGDPPPNDRR